MSTPQLVTPEDLIEVQIRGLMLDPVTNMPIVILKDLASDLVLPIWIGPFEANAIAHELEKATPQRPMTHDLLRSLVLGLDAAITRIVISDLRDDTFIATLHLTQHTDEITIDARPSDAIALALRADCPIFVSAGVLGRTRQSNPTAANMDSEELRRWLENLNEDDTGQYKM